ncbi:CTP synthase [Verrucomicrobiaceae bacterium R5-34]|uniref:CTP synthase n=1 Tax=Oceaniferula flava TaxID=2800421 RepID=A0AAE2SDP9_9BACT|nr:CTP synthase [Oceaniferula flavus]MBK1830755.1 CTP synthase [Verrucomicrobiaceae bacterium R5-34]MBK1856013.1 CTP synthase [Oceaniferula flavus]MBM1137320.1 CTP synthase [Oceaniferula flavus]
MPQPTKYIFVTGGVVSSLGKGLAAASLGTLLEHRGLSVILQKFDPYLNVDPGTMSPYQHGEVYVLDDGAETDLDLGHYERFTNCTLTRFNNLTSGQVFENVIRKERKGEYLGKTVQFIPHCTDEIKARINDVTLRSDADVIITEIGGTVGDIEGHLFLEALRQFSLEVGRDNVCFVHVTLLPRIRAAGEIKTKPTQQSVAKLREIGIMPDIIVCRTEHDLDEENKKKIAMFCNVEPGNVVAFRDVDHTIYECPLDLRRDKLDRLVSDKLGIESETPDLKEWREFVDRIINPTHEVNIAVVGKYIELQDAYKSIYESLTHAGAAHDTRINLVRVEAEAIEEDGAVKHLSEVNGILIPGGFGDRGTEGKILTAKFARENNIPYFGICLGMQIATIEFARNVCGLTTANSTEFDKDTEHPVISLQEEQQGIEDLGATMRLGASDSVVYPDTKAAELYGAETISERHRHRYEFNPSYREQVENAGMKISSVSADQGLVEIVEIPEHPFFIGAQFHPEFQSKPNHPHPLFSGFVAASLAAKNEA